eukprot:92945-Prymnesium_polylepis.2
MRGVRVSLWSVYVRGHTEGGPGEHVVLWLRRRGGDRVREIRARDTDRHMVRNQRAPPWFPRPPQCYVE